MNVFSRYLVVPRLPAAISTKGVGNPIYDAGDVDYLLVNQAIVQFKSAASQADIDALLGRYCALSVKRRQRAKAWRHVVRFDGQVARHALAMTNRLAREGIVSFAQPDFIVVGESTYAAAWQPQSARRAPRSRRRAASILISPANGTSNIRQRCPAIPLPISMRNTLGRSLKGRAPSWRYLMMP